MKHKNGKKGGGRPTLQNAIIVVGAVGSMTGHVACTSEISTADSAAMERLEHAASGGDAGIGEPPRDITPVSTKKVLRILNTEVRSTEVESADGSIHIIQGG